MKKAAIVLLITLSICTIAFAQSKPKRTFPFTVRQVDGKYMISAEIEEPPLYPKYFNLFKKYNYTGNGQTWSDLIQQILKKQAPDLLGRIQLDPEASMFAAYANTVADEQRFLNILVPVFSNLSMLEHYIKQADRSKFDD